MSLLDLFRRSRLKINTPEGNKPTTYQDTVPQMRNIRFPRNLSPENSFDQYVRFEGVGTVPDSPLPEPFFMVTETNDFLITENDNNLILEQETL